MIRVMNHILIDVVVESLALVFPVPTEPFVGGVENHFAPTVENHDFKIIDLALHSFRQEEAVVYAV